MFKRLRERIRDYFLPGLRIDGIQVKPDHRWMLAGQLDPKGNGIYKVSTGKWDAPIPEPIEAERYCLGLLTGEMGEANAVIGNALRFGYDTYEKERMVDELLAEELSDVQAAIKFSAMHGLVDEPELDLLTAKKLAKLLNPEARDNLGRRLAPAPPEEELQKYYDETNHQHEGQE